MIPWGAFPFNDEFKKITEGMKSGNVQSYVDEMMKKFNVAQFGDSPMNEKTPPSFEQAEQKANVFETFDYVYIRLELPSEVSLDQLRIFHTSNQAIIENLHEEERRKVIILPCLVKKKELPPK